MPGMIWQRPFPFIWPCTHPTRCMHHQHALCTPTGDAVCCARRAYGDEAEATVAELKTKNNYTRPQLWQTPDNAYSLEGIGPMDRFGVTKQVHVARAEHAAQYTEFIRAGRTAAARKYLTQEEGDESDVNLGMKPYRWVVHWWLTLVPSNSCNRAPWGPAGCGLVTCLYTLPAVVAEG